MNSLRSFLRQGGAAVRILALMVILLAVTTAFLVPHTASVRYRRDLTRMVFNDNLELLEDVKRSVGEAEDTLRQTLVETGNSSLSPDKPYLVVSIADHRVWFKQGNDVLFSTRIATGSGKVLAKGGGNQWKFETPRGRLSVLYKEVEPAWVPPDWHFVEVAHKKKLGLKMLVRGESVPIDDAGTVLAVDGNDVVRRYADGTQEVIESGEGKEIIANGRVIVPPFGTNQRRYPGVVGTHRLNLGDGYALHGTDVPSSIGQSVSHGCVRLRNEDIETLYRIVPVGTPVFIY